MYAAFPSKAVFHSFSEAGFSKEFALPEASLAPRKVHIRFLNAIEVVSYSLGHCNILKRVHLELKK